MLTIALRPTCCERATQFSDTSFGIVHSSEADYGKPDLDLKPGWYLLYDGGYEKEPILFCPFCGKSLTSPGGDAAP